MARSVRNVAAAGVLALLAGCASCDGEESCPSGQTSCIDGCVDLLGNLRNCGTCGNRCASGASCDGGVCACPSGQEVCHGGCIDPATYAGDPLNCGGCGIACGSLGTCTNGGCVCTDPAVRCDQNDPRCVDPATDARNCGGCGLACKLKNEICVTSQCACPDTLPTECPPPPAPATACVNLTDDATNCGACGNVCQTGATCQSRTCTCVQGLTECTSGGSKVCANLDADASNCGACGTACATGSTCLTGLCCPAARPVVCGSTGTGTGQCCAGRACCGTACQTEHTNGPSIIGLGQHFYDCDPLGTYDHAHAVEAARAWQPSGTEVPASQLPCITQDCIGWRTASACGTWCWGGVVAGQATLNTINSACLCPTGTTPNWN